MTSRNLYTDAQAIATLRSLSARQINALPLRTQTVLRRAVDDLDKADRLLRRAEKREADLVLVYEPVMDFEDGSTPETRFCKDGAEGFVENPYSMRDEPKGNPLTVQVMRDHAAQLRAAVASNAAKRALASVR